MDFITLHLKKHWIRYLIGSLALTASIAILQLLIHRKSIQHIAVIRDHRLLPLFKKLESSLPGIEISVADRSAHVSGLPASKNFKYLTVLRNEHHSVMKYAKNILYSTETESTSQILEDYFAAIPDGLLYVADVQYRGKGRTRTWEGPLGCLMFSYKFCCESKFSPAVNLIIPIAIIKAIKTVGFQMSANLSLITKLGLRWPNDVFFEDQVIGGALVNILPKGNWIYMTIGIGINVDNTKPTTCLNAHFNGKFTREHILIEYLKSFDELFNRLTTDPTSVLVEYKESWIHYNSSCILQATSEPVILTDINIEGYLTATKQSGETVVIRSRDEILIPNQLT